MATWDVTADVMAGKSRWSLRSGDEADPSPPAFYTPEGAEAAGDPDLAPRLVLE